MVGWLYCRKCLIIDWLITAIACTTHKYTFIRYMWVAVDQVILLAILEKKSQSQTKYNISRALSSSK